MCELPSIAIGPPDGATSLAVRPVSSTDLGDSEPSAKERAGCQMKGLHAIKLRTIYKHVGSRSLDEAAMPFPCAHIQLHIASVPKLTDKHLHST